MEQALMRIDSQLYKWSGQLQASQIGVMTLEKAVTLQGLQGTVHWSHSFLLFEGLGDAECSSCCPFGTTSK